MIESLLLLQTQSYGWQKQDDKFKKVKCILLLLQTQPSEWQNLCFCFKLSHLDDRSKLANTIKKNQHDFFLCISKICLQGRNYMILAQHNICILQASPVNIWIEQNLAFLMCNDSIHMHTEPDFFVIVTL